MKKRIIARLDIKNDYVIKGIHLEGLRKVGNPKLLSNDYYESGIDEIIFMDSVAAYYDRNSIGYIIDGVTDDIFVPVTVGGGIRNIDDIRAALMNGADKVAINTQAVRNKEFICAISNMYGSQCITASIEAKKNGNSWEAYIENGREKTGYDVLEWAKELQDLGAGEILLTSVDREGTQKGFEIDLVNKISQVVNLPIIVSGGAGKVQDIVELFKETDCSAVALASILHYKKTTVTELKLALLECGINVRL